MKKRLIRALNSIPKEKLIGALSTIPLIAASTMSGSCAASCPYGLVNDPYPGQCPRYSDLNRDGICDFSQATATVATTDSGTSSDTSTPSSSTDDTPTITTSTSDQSHGNGAVSDPGTPQVDNNASTITDQGSGLDIGNFPGDGHGYYVLPVSILLISGYLFTHYLFSKGILKREKHRRIWNLLVTAGYLGTGVTGVILVLIINLGIRTALNPSITFWHAELAILMTIGTLIHVHLYRKPFKNMFKVLFGFNSFRTYQIQSFIDNLILLVKK
jgi:hypothetical protein